MFLVGYSPLTNSNNLYSSFFVKSLNDEMLKFTNKKDPFTSDEEYIGVGEFVANNNTLDLFTDSILGVKGRLATPALFEHRNLNYLLRTLDWFNENPRAETISRIMALALALGVTTSKTQHIQNKFIPLPDVQDIKTLLEPEVEKAKKTAFEQEDEKLWHRYKEQGVPFADVLKYAGISEKDLLNGKMHEFDKIAKKILESKYCGIDYSKNPCFQNLGIFNSSFIFKSKAGMADSIIDVADDKMIDIGTAEYNFLIARNIARCILLPDGTYEEFRRENSHVDNKTWLENGVLSAKLRFILTDNSVVLCLDSENKKMKVEVGKSFEDREYQSAEDFISSLRPSITKPFTLTKEQTRAILNIAHAQNIAFEDITLDENLSFNQTIIEKEMATDKNEQTPLKANSENKAQQQADVINHFSKQKTEKKEIKVKSSTENEVSIKT